MRDIFEDIFAGEPASPMESAQRSMRPTLRKRFYESAAAGEVAGGAYPVLLDGKPVRTPAHKPLAAPTRALAQAIAGEWQAQAEVIDPAAMPLTRLANTIIDGVAAAREEVAAEVEKFIGTDLLFYRADKPERLVALERQHWDPVVDWAREQLGALFVLTAGIIHVPQPDYAIANAARAIPSDPWRLGAMHTITTLTGSALLALAVAEKAIDAETAWTAANVGEDWNMEQWGRDDMALARRAARHAEMQAAATVLALTA
jgi:chaperone required for assembly of F1-ATPase